MNTKTAIKIIEAEVRETASVPAQLAEMARLQKDLGAAVVKHGREAVAAISTRLLGGRNMAHLSLTDKIDMIKAVLAELA